MTQPLRIGFIGAGGNTRQMHIPGFQAIEGVELAVVANRTVASAQKVAQEFGIAHAVGDWRDVVADPEVDAVCIGTWPYMHAEVTIAALEAGKHVLTEARMARNLSEAKKMQAAAEAHPQLVAQIVPAPFTFKYDATIMGMLEREELGELREIRVAHLNGSAADASAPVSWRQDEELSGKNILTMGIHYEAVQRWLGQKDPKWVQATGTIFTHQRLNTETGKLQEIHIPEALNIVTGYEDGSQLVMTLSSVANGTNYMGVRLDGSAGSLRYDLGSQNLFHTPVGGHEGEALAPVNEGNWQVEADFVASIREQRPVTLTGFADGVRYMHFTDCVWESWTHEGVRIPW